MTHYFNKPLFTCAERDKLNPIVVYDVLSFIHLMRLNLPCFLPLLRPRYYRDKEHMQEERLSRTRVGDFNWWTDCFFYFEPKSGVCQITHFTPSGGGYYHRNHVTYDMSDSNIYRSNHWDNLIRDLKAVVPFTANPIEDFPIEIDSLKNKKKVWHFVGKVNGKKIDREMSPHELLDFIKVDPKMFRPSDCFKGRAKSVLTPERLPFDD